VLLCIFDNIFAFIRMIMMIITVVLQFILLFLQNVLSLSVR